MDINNFSTGQFLGLSSLNEVATSYKGVGQEVGESLHSAGLISPSSITISVSGNTINLTCPKPFRVLFSNGTIASANGTTNGSSSDTASVNFTSIIPSSGSITAYLLVSASTVLQDPYTLIGPPPGHPSYNPTATPTIAYNTIQDTLVFTASTTAPDNSTTFQILNTTLTAGQSSIGSYSTASQVEASAVLDNSGVTAGVYSTPDITIGSDGRITSASENTNVALLNAANNFTVIPTINSNKIVSLPSGNITYMPFFQASAPVGWTQNTTINDQVLRVVSGSGGGTGGSWSVTGFTANSHTHTMQDHQHETPVGTQSGSAGNSITPNQSSSPFGTGATVSMSGRSAGTNQGGYSVVTWLTSSMYGGAGSTGIAAPGVYNDGTWRPAYIDMIVCSLN